jgi:hypothetical protein
VLGRPRAFVHFFIVVAALGLALALRSEHLNAAIGLLLLAFFIVGSVAALWKIRGERGNPNANTFPSQIGWLPKQWQKWILGESDDDRSK